jgi:hypothetical protein
MLYRAKFMRCDYKGKPTISQGDRVGMDCGIKK